MVDELQAKVEGLRKARAVLARRVEDAAEVKAGLEATFEWRANEACNYEVSVAKQEVENYEADVRDCALAMHAETGNTKFAGVAIKMMTRLIYSAERATEWARVYAPAMMILDKKSFEAAAKSGAMQMPVELWKEPHVYIDKDLGEVAG